MIRRHLAWILLGLSLTLNVFFVGGFVYARYYGAPWGAERGPWQPQRLDGRWLEELNLDPAQQRAFRQAFRELRQRNVERARELIQVRRRLMAEMRKDRMDFAVIEPLLDRAAKLRGDMQKDGLRTADQVSATLRPEQREKFREAVSMRALGMPGAGGRPGLRRPDERRPQ
jgi:Spy/CpxP family protein refolding chaperone